MVLERYYGFTHEGVHYPYDGAFMYISEGFYPQYMEDPSFWPDFGARNEILTDIKDQYKILTGRRMKGRMERYASQSLRKCFEIYRRDGRDKAIGCGIKQLSKFQQYFAPSEIVVDYINQTQKDLERMMGEKNGI